MKIIENIKLLHRANRYKYMNDKGGIAYINANVSEGQTVMDIGANKAGYLYFLLKQIGHKGKAIAFEPQTTLFQYITKIKKTFSWNNLTVEHLVISDEEGVAILYIPGEKTGKDCLMRSTVIKQTLNSEFLSTEGVNSETLDTYCERKKIRPDFIKIDVGGNELKVLEGGIDTLKYYKPKILVEIDARHIGEMMVLETFQFMQWMKYKGSFINGLKRLPLDQFNFEIHQNTNNMDKYCNNFIFE
jgi:FkbM family methyltransferase